MTRVSWNTSAGRGAWLLAVSLALACSASDGTRSDGATSLPFDVAPEFGEVTAPDVPEVVDVLGREDAAPVAVDAVAREEAPVADATTFDALAAVVDAPVPDPVA